MKKKLGYTFLILAMVIALIYFLRYKQGLVYEQKVPSNVTAIVHIDARQIEHHVLVDALKNPSKYIDLKFSKKEKDSLQFKKLVQVPKNLFFFTNETSLKNSWFSSFLRIKNAVKLAQYLVREGFEQLNDSGILIFKKEKFFFALKEERLLIAYDINGQEISVTTFKSIFNEVTFLAEQADLLEPIVNSQSDISYVTTTNDFVEADFKNGVLAIKGIVNSKVFLNAKYKAINENSIAYLNTRINKDHQFFRPFFSNRSKSKFNDFTKLSIDSIVNTWSGGLHFDLKSIKREIDTIVTYEFDDDFNKLEKKSVQERIVPEVNFQLEAKPHLFRYLTRTKAIQVIENDTVFTKIPLYRMFANSGNDVFEISTIKNFTKPEFQKNEYKMKAYFDVESYLQNPLEFGQLALDNATLQLLKNVSIELSKNNEFFAYLHLKNEDRNFVGQIVKP